MKQVQCLLPLLFAAALILSACEKKETTPPTPQTTEQPSPAPSTPAPETPAAPTEQQPATAGTEGGEVPKGEKVYKEVCATCHDQGLAGAPKTGDSSAWQPRIAKGMETLVKHSIEGFQGNQGVMPPKGGVQSLSEEDVAAAVEYMVEKSR